ncbi:MAG: hypothetical protein J0I92_16570, partial [Phyllobacterium sp.]|nr:hypothetical protein [Phyllobacterium sp.]
ADKALLPLLQRHADALLQARRPHEAGIVAQVQPGVLATLKMCNGDWCRLIFSGASGWMRQSDIWGAYPGEKFD